MPKGKTDHSVYPLQLTQDPLRPIPPYGTDEGYVTDWTGPRQWLLCGKLGLSGDKDEYRDFLTCPLLLKYFGVLHRSYHGQVKTYGDAIWPGVIFKLRGRLADPAEKQAEYFCKTIEEAVNKYGWDGVVESNWEKQMDFVACVIYHCDREAQLYHQSRTEPDSAIVFELNATAIVEDFNKTFVLDPKFNGEKESPVEGDNWERALPAGLIKDAKPHETELDRYDRFRLLLEHLGEEFGTTTGHTKWNQFRSSNGAIVPSNEPLWWTGALCGETKSLLDAADDFAAHSSLGNRSLNLRPIPCKAFFIIESDVAQHIQDIEDEDAKAPGFKHQTGTFSIGDPSSILDLARWRNDIRRQCHLVYYKLQLDTIKVKTYDDADNFLELVTVEGDRAMLSQVELRDILQKDGVHHATFILDLILYDYDDILELEDISYDMELLTGGKIGEPIPTPKQTEIKKIASAARAALSSVAGPAPIPPSTATPVALSSPADEAQRSTTSTSPKHRSPTFEYDDDNTKTQALAKAKRVKVYRHPH